MRLFAFLCSSCLFLFSSSTSARSNSSSHYIALDIYSGTLALPCTNTLDGQAPSLTALEDPSRCYGIEGDHNITCISRHMNRINDEERMISTAQLDCKVQGYTNINCSGPTFWPAEYVADNQTWTWMWDRSVGIVDIRSFGMTCY